MENGPDSRRQSGVQLQENTRYTGRQKTRAYQKPGEQYIYDSPVTQAPPSNGCAAGGFVCALLGLIFCWIPVVGFILLVLGLVLSAAGLAASKSRSGAGKGLGIAGLVTALVPGIILAVLTVSCTGCIGSLSL